MSVRFAAPLWRFGVHFRGTLTARPRGRPVNDNGDERDEALLNAALRHFADHGIAAAEHARRRAEAALREGDRQAHLWWLEICRTLDRRLARDLDQRQIRPD